MVGIDALLANDKQETEIRRVHSVMKCTGRAVELFAVWNILKSIMYLGLDTPVTRYIDEAFDGEVVKSLVKIITLVLVLIDAYIRLYVGRKIVREAEIPPGIIVKKSGKEKVKGRTWLNILMGLLLVESVYGVFAVFLNDPGISTRFDLIVSSFVELTILIILIRMVIATYKMRQYRKDRMN